MDTDGSWEKPGIVLGTSSFGSSINGENCIKIVSKFINYHTNLNEKLYIDSAIVYSNGKSELMLSKYTNNPNILISTKFHPMKFNGLTKESIKLQTNISLYKLHCSFVDILYIHQGTTSIPILETLFAVNELYKEGKFKRFGICHYASWQVVEILFLCNKYNLIKPSVYQGRYNALRRENESELLECLRYFNIPFYAFSPTAKGILIGNHKYLDLEKNLIKKGKFTSNNKAIHCYDYWYSSLFNARNHILNVCNKENISLSQATFSWLLYHSKLNGNKGDRIILGGSKYKHFDDNLNYIKNAKPLNKDLLNAFENGWKMARSQYLEYHRVIQQFKAIKQSKL